MGLLPRYELHRRHRLPSHHHHASHAEQRHAIHRDDQRHLRRDRRTFALHLEHRQRHAAASRTQHDRRWHPQWHRHRRSWHLQLQCEAPRQQRMPSLEGLRARRWLPNHHRWQHLTAAERHHQRRLLGDAERLHRRHRRSCSNLHLGSHGRHTATRAHPQQRRLAQRHADSSWLVCLHRRRDQSAKLRGHQGRHHDGELCHHHARASLTAADRYRIRGLLAEHHRHRRHRHLHLHRERRQHTASWPHPQQHRRPQRHGDRCPWRV